MRVIDLEVPTMKKLLCLLTLLLLLTGCGSIMRSTAETVDLMPGVSPGNSALGLYIYDGETITRRHLFETEAVRAEAIEPFRTAKVKPAAVDMTTLRPPFYGLEMGGSDGWSVYGLWSDGYFIMGDGTAYEFDYDFEAFRQRYAFGEPDEFQTLTVMPCASHVAKSETGWNKAFLTEAELPVAQKSPSALLAGGQPKSSLSATLMGQTEKEITVEFTNLGDPDCGYGYAYSLQVLLDGKWYSVPAEQEMAFIEILVHVPVGGSKEENFSLEPYGDLPAGTYRVLTNGLTVEFSIE